MCSVRVDYVGGRGAGKCAGRALRALPALSINAYRDSHVFVLHANWRRSRHPPTGGVAASHQPPVGIWWILGAGGWDVRYLEYGLMLSTQTTAGRP